MRKMSPREVKSGFSGLQGGGITMWPIRWKQALETEDPFCLWTWMIEQGLNRGMGKGGTQKRSPAGPTQLWWAEG